MNTIWCQIYFDTMVSFDHDPFCLLNMFTRISINFGGFGCLAPLSKLIHNSLKKWFFFSSRKYLFSY